MKRRNLKSVEVKVENVILKPKHSEVVRCENCFISHFPKRKFCKCSMRKKVSLKATMEVLLMHKTRKTNQIDTEASIVKQLIKGRH